LIYKGSIYKPEGKIRQFLGCIVGSFSMKVREKSLEKRKKKWVNTEKIEKLFGPYQVLGKKKPPSNYE